LQSRAFVKRYRRTDMLRKSRTHCARVKMRKAGRTNVSISVGLYSAATDGVWT
jgi:hypothetical protein